MDVVSSMTTLRIGTANIQNFPDMTPAQVDQDCKTVRGLSPDLMFWQEIGEAADFSSIIGAFGNKDFGTTTHASECVTTWKNAAMSIVGASQTLSIAPAAPGPYSPPRYLSRVVLLPAGGALPAIEAQDIHYTNGAYAGEKRADRYPCWQQCWDAHKALALKARAAGRIVIFGGDWNRAGRDIPLFAPDQKWIVGGGGWIDNIGILLPPGVTCKVQPTVVTHLNSDHDALTAYITLSPVPATPPPPPVTPKPAAVQDAIDHLAAARASLVTVKDAGWLVKTSHTLSHVQDAINVLYGP